MKRRMMIFTIAALMLGMIGAVSAQEQERQEQKSERSVVKKSELLLKMAKIAKIDLGGKTLVQLASELSAKGIEPQGGWNMGQKGSAESATKVGDLVVTLLQITGNGDKVVSDSKDLAKVASEVLGMDTKTAGDIEQALYADRVFTLLDTPEIKEVEEKTGLQIQFGTPN